jgi:hypothetical protein
VAVPRRRLFTIFIIQLLLLCTGKLGLHQALP